MKAEDIYKGSTLEGLQKGLNALDSYDDNLTVGEIKKVIQDLMPNREEEEKLAKERLTEKLDGKVLKIKFSDDHITWLKIDSIELTNKYGLDAKLFGQKISYYKGQIDTKVMDGSDEWRQFCFNKGEEQISKITFRKTLEKFEALKKNVLG